MSRYIGSTMVPRNPVVRSLAGRRGGAHEVGKTSERHQVRTKLNRQLDNWRDDLEFERELKEPSDLNQY